MKLDKKKTIASRVLNIGKGRVWFNPERLQEIKEAITRQDIKDLIAEKVIKIKDIRGGKKKEKRKTRRRAGRISRKIKIARKKITYVNKIRKLRKYLKVKRTEGKISSAEYRKLRNYAKSGIFKGLKHLKEYTK